MMTKLGNDIQYGDYIIQIYDYGDSKYSFEMLDSNKNLLCNIALWSLKKKYIHDGTGELIHNQHDLFNVNDYYQEDLQAVKKRQGYCSTLQEFFITNLHNIPFTIDNIYSSFKMTTDNGIEFWKKQVIKGKAEYVEHLERYRLKLV